MMQLLLCDQRRDPLNPDQLMAQERWVLALLQGAAEAAGIRAVLHLRIYRLDL